MYMSIQECMQTLAAPQLSAHRSRRVPGPAIMRRLALGFVLPSLAAGHLSSGGAPQHRGGAFLQPQRSRTSLFNGDDSIYNYDLSAILAPIVNGSAAAGPPGADLQGDLVHGQSVQRGLTNTVRPFVEDVYNHHAAGRPGQR